MAPPWWPRPFSAQNGCIFFKVTLALDNGPLSNGPLSNHTKFQLDWSKNGRVMAEKRMPIYGHMRVSGVNFGL